MPRVFAVSRGVVRLLGSTLLLLLLSTGASAAAPRLDFREVGVSRSFDAEIITEVFRDRVGLLWIGTREARV